MVSECDTYLEQVCILDFLIEGYAWEYLENCQSVEEYWLLKREENVMDKLYSVLVLSSRSRKKSSADTFVRVAELFQCNGTPFPGKGHTYTHRERINVNPIRTLLRTRARRSWGLAKRAVATKFGRH